MVSSSIIIISVGRAFQIIAGLLAVRFFTSLLSTAEVGNLYLINSVAAILGFTLLNPVGMYMNRKLNSWLDDRTLLDKFYLYNWYLLGVALLAIPLVIVLNRAFDVGGSINLWQLALYVTVFLFINTWNGTLIATFNLLEHRVTFVVYTLLTTLSGLGLSILFVMNKHTAIWWLTGQVVAQALITPLVLVHLLRMLKEHVDFVRAHKEVTRFNMRQVLWFVAPLGTTTLLVWIQSQSYRLIIENRIGLDFLAQMGLGFSLAANILCAVEGVVHQAYLPGFYREVSSGDTDVRRDVCNRMFQNVLPVFLSLTLAVTFLSPFLVRLLAHAKFEDAFQFAMYAAWIELFRMTTSILSISAHAEMQTRFMVKAYAVGSILAAVGVLGASYTSWYRHSIPAALLCAGFVTMVIMFVEMKKIVRVKVGIRRIVSSGVYTLPCAGALLFFSFRNSVTGSLLVTGVAGSYLLLVQYLIYRRTVVSGGLQ